jgi:hypothetical protein
MQPNLAAYSCLLFTLFSFSACDPMSMLLLSTLCCRKIMRWSGKIRVRAPTGAIAVLVLLMYPKSPAHAFFLRDTSPESCLLHGAHRE